MLFRIQKDVYRLECLQQVFVDVMRDAKRVSELKVASPSLG